MADLWYAEGYSGKGSIIRENATINLAAASAEFETIKMIALSPEKQRQFEFPLCFDLIKIDVEGYEREVLDGLVDVRARSIFVEFSINRAHAYTLPGLFGSIEKVLGPFEILYMDRIDCSNRSATIGSLLARAVDYTSSGRSSAIRRIT